jgi:hypothetical protein
MTTSFWMWLKANADVFPALAGAGVLFGLNLFGVVPPAVAQDGLLAVLGVIAAAMIHERWNRAQDQRRRSGELNEMRATVADLTQQCGALLAAVRTVTGATAVEVVSQADVAEELARAQRTTSGWSYRGTTGARLRDHILPACLEHVRRAQRPLKLTVELLDIGDVDQCQKYARTRSRLDSVTDPNGEGWTVARVRHEVYATVLALCWYRDRFDPLLDVALAFSPVYQTQRIDIADHMMIMTPDDPREPGLVVRKDSMLYPIYVSQLRESFLQSREMPIRLVRRSLTADRPRVADVRLLFRTIGLEQSDLSDAEVERIIRKVRVDGLVTAS